MTNVAVFQQVQKGRNTLSQLLKWLAITGAVLALGGPAIEDRVEESSQIGYDITLILDTSGSMKEEGFDPSNPRRDKFSAVKEVASEFIRKRERDNLSLVVFGRFAFVASPLTFDKEILDDILKRLSIGMAGEKTAIHDAIALGMKTFEASEAKSKIAILLTDGMNTAGQIPENVAMNMAQKQGVKIYTIGIGRTGNFDKLLLTEIAQQTGGKFYQATNKRVLEKVYDEIDHLEKSEIKGRKFVKKTQLFIYPLFVSVIALLFFIYFRNRQGM